MANINDRLEINVDGKYFVDSNCTFCGLCADMAPENFDLNDDEGFAYVKKQPEDDSELAACDAALDSCPVEAIGKTE